MKKLLLWLSSRKFEALLAALFILVYLCGFRALRLVRDDWSSISNFSRGLHANPMGLLVDVINNQWIGLNQSRIFFFAWLLQIAVGFFGRYNYVPYYLFILTWHLISSILLFAILRKHLRAPAFAALLSCVYLTAPADTNVLFWLNNWFFSIPLFFLIAQLYVLTFPFRRPAYQVAALSLLTILGQFSGEQAIAMFYLSFGIFILRALVTLRGAERRHAVILLLIPSILSAFALFAYVEWVMVYSVTQNKVEYSLENVRNYFRQFFNFFGQTVTPKTEFYGYSTLPFGLKTTILTVIEAFAVIAVFFVSTSNKEWEMPKRRAFTVAAALLLYAAAALAPCIYGALTGIRPGVSWRYLFVPSFPITGCCLLLIGVILGSCPPKWRRYSMLPVLAFVIYLSALTTYTLNRIWGFQKALDNSIWSAIDARILPRHTFIVTVNLTEKQAQLFPAYYSQAISDFQADWGVGQRLWFTQQRHFEIGQSVEEIPGSDNLKVKGYYDGMDWVTPKDSVLFVTYQYGRRYANLKDARLHVFANYGTFKDFIEGIKH